MKHLTLITLDYPPEHGGVARYLGELVRASNGGIGAVVVEQNHTLSGPGQVIPRELFWHGWPRWLPMVRVCLEAGRKKQDQRTRPMLLISHVLPVGTAACIALWLGGAPYAVICHGLDVRLAARNAWKRRLFRWVCEEARVVVVNSQSTAEDVRKLVPGMTPLVLTPGVRPDALLDRATARKRLGISDDEEVVLCVARLVPRKGIDLLFEAAEQLRDRERVRIVVVGDGSERAHLEQLAEHLKHPVTFVTDADDDILGAWYDAADVFCLPTRDDGVDVEGFGIVYLEAGAHGLPVVASTAGGASEAVQDGVTGLLVPQNDPEALAGALRRLLDDPALRMQLGAAGAERVRMNFAWEDRWKQLSGLLNDGEMAA